ncbi:MAG TPA: gliding motility-associated C-terminal domain-containing protein [Bacteroidales bacterium]|nr:gliding motility-associated C-terminal domain-containing protein [Bacteroidales bacterium]
MKQRIFFYILIFLQYFLNGQVSVPELRCLEVINNGDVTITWLASNDPNGDFVAYEIFSSNNVNGPYSLIVTINNIAVTSYTHLSAQANLHKVYYYLRAKFGSPITNTSNSDTLSTIYLVLTDPLNGTALLSWNELHIPRLITSSDFEIYRKYPLGSWTLIDLETNTNYVDTIYHCSDTIAYKILQKDISGCISTSNFDNALLRNIMPPQSPWLDSVTVLPNGHAAMGWQASNSNDVIAYIIYKYESGFWTPIDTVYGSTYFENSNSTASDVAEQYRVAALDSCGNTSPLSNAIETINVTGNLSICDNIFYLSWNHPAGVLYFDNYRILLSKNSNPFVQLDITTKDTFNLYLDENQGNWCIVIQSITDDSITQSSNLLCFNFQKPSLPDYVKLRKVDFINNHIEITWKAPSHASVQGFQIYRSTDSLVSFKKIVDIQKNILGDYFYIDPLTNFPPYPIFYKIATIDSCGNAVFQSDTASTLYLKGVVNFDITNTLFWQGKMSSSVTDSQQILHKKIDNISIWDLPLPDNQRVFIDDLSTNDDIESSGHFSYQVEWPVYLEPPFDDYDTIHSLWIDLYQPPRIYLPTGFTPSSEILENQIFKPNGIFLKSKDYSFTIFDRNGRIVFETNNLNEGWNGNSFDNNPEPEQLYVYLLKITLINGNAYEKRGIVTLYR